jgi:hypothetical protein
VNRTNAQNCSCQDTRFLEQLKGANYQYSKTYVMHFLFNLLRIKGLYMFRALLAHPQKALNKRHLVYCVRVPLQSWCNQYTHAIYQVRLVQRLLRMNT